MIFLVIFILKSLNQIKKLVSETFLSNLRDADFLLEFEYMLFLSLIDRLSDSPPPLDDKLSSL